MPIAHQLTDLIGNTPLLALERFAPGARILAKLECFNPLSSAKDRAALSMLDAAEAAGQLLTNGRQTDAVRRALEAVERAQAALEAGVTPDALLTDVEEAMAALGELTGKTLREDITQRIFDRFCVGK